MSIEQEIYTTSLSDIVQFIKKNLLNIVSVFIIISFVSSSLILFFFSYKPNSNEYALVSISIDNDFLHQNFNNTYINSKEIINEALKRSDLLDSISSSHITLLSESMIIIKGEAATNSFLNSPDIADASVLVSEKFVKGVKIEHLVSNINKIKDRIKTIQIKTNNFPFSDEEWRSFFSSLLYVSNKEIQNSFSIETGNLRSIKLLEGNSDNMYVIINEIGGRISILEKYIKEIKKKYSNYAKEINIQELEYELDNLKKLYFFVISSSENGTEFYQNQMLVNITHLEKTISNLNDLYSKIDNNSRVGSVLVQKDGDVEKSQGISVGINQSVFNKLMSLGKDTGLSKYKLEILEEIKSLIIEKNSLERELELSKTIIRVNNSYTEEDTKIIYKNLNNITDTINKYIVKVQDYSGIEEKIIQQFGPVNLTKKPLIDKNFSIRILVSIFSALALSIAYAVTIGMIRNWK